MKGRKCLKRVFILLGALVVLSWGILPKNANAISVPYTQFGLYESYYTQATGCNNYQYQEGYVYDQNIILCSARAFLAETTQVQSTGEFWSASGKVNIVRRRVFRADGKETNAFVNLEKIDILSASHAAHPLIIQSTSVQTFKTKWQVNSSEKYETLTIQYNVSGRDATNAYGAFRILIGSNDYAFLWPNEQTSPPYSGVIYFENTWETPNVNFSGTFSDGSSQTIIDQNNTQISQNNQIINQNNETNQYLSEQAEQDAEDRDNVSSTSTDAEQDAANAESQASATGTTLLEAFSHLILALESFRPSARCTLPEMQVYSLNFGRINLCSVNVPQSIKALSGVAMCFMIVPLGINLVKRMIALYKEITG